MLTLAASTGNAIALAAGGIVAVLAVCAVFYAIGRGEDRDRVAPAPTEEPPDPAEEPEPQAAYPPRERSPEGARRRRRP